MQHLRRRVLENLHHVRYGEVKMEKYTKTAKVHNSHFKQHDWSEHLNLLVVHSVHIRGKLTVCEGDSYKRMMIGSTSR